MSSKTIWGVTTTIAAGLVIGCGSSTHSTSSTKPPTSSTGTARAHGPNLREHLPGSAHAKSLGAARQLRPQRSGPQPHLTGYPSALPQKLAAMAADVVHTWSPLQPPPATLNVISDTPVTCQTNQGTVEVNADSPPQYCLADASLDLPVGYIGSRIEPIGDAAVLLVVADVYSFHILNALGQLSTSAGLTGAQILQRDACFSGLYFTAIPTTRLSPNDTDAVNNELRAMSAPGTPAAANSVTAQQLTDAFNRGVLARHLKTCFI